MSSEKPLHSSSQRAWSKLAVIALTAGLVLVIPASASLAACPATDPLCIVDETRQAEDPAPPNLPPVDDVGKNIDGVADSVKREADKVVGQVTGAVDDLLNPGGDPGGGGGPGGEGEGGSGGGSSDGTEGAAGGSGGTSTGSPVLGSVPAPVTVPSTPTAFRDQPGILGRIGGAVSAVAGQLGFPVALALVVLAFAAIQNYLDRKDPKLALAPVRPEVMKFE